MKVSSLIYRLQRLPQNAEICVSSDSEGNNIFRDVTICQYQANEELNPVNQYCIFPNESSNIAR
jgi:hypothetical protein